MSMKNRLGVVVSAVMVTVMFSAAPAFAAKQSKAENTVRTHQRNTRMAECNHKAKGMKGDAHRKFMSECMKKPAARQYKQTRMAECNHKAKGMKGDAHRKFMSECMKKPAAKHHTRKSMKNRAKTSSAKKQESDK